MKGEKNMFPKEKNSTKEGYFHLAPEDRLEFELENQEKEEKEIITEKVFDRLKEKDSQ